MYGTVMAITHYVKLQNNSILLSII